MPGCRLAKQASLFYEEMQRCLYAPPLAQHFDKSWTAHATVKAAVYDCEAHLQNAADLHSKDEIAVEICRLQVCLLELIAAGIHPPLPVSQHCSPGSGRHCTPADWGCCSVLEHCDLAGLSSTGPPLVAYYTHLLMTACSACLLTCQCPCRRPARLWQPPSGRPRRWAGSCRTPSPS